jgi:DNA-binding winged helix-turn-helix (wHTH) protein
MPVRFAEFTLDRDQRLLTRGEITVPLAGKAFDLLDLLVSERPRALSKERIRDQVWPKTFVSESTLNGLVAELRAALGDDAREPRYVRTVHGSATRSPPRSSKSETTPRPPRGLRRRGS